MLKLPKISSETVVRLYVICGLLALAWVLGDQHGYVLGLERGLQQSSYSTK